MQNSRIVYTRFSKDQSVQTSNEPYAVHSKSKLIGNLSIKRSGIDTGFAERVRIGASLRGNVKPKTIKEWERIVKNKSPTTTPNRNFQIDENFWFGKGISWVIPTPLFETTSIKLNLEASALLSTGFIIEIFRRDSTIVHEVKPTTVFTGGCIVKFDVNWNLSTNTANATPILKPRKWTQPPTQTGSQPSLTSGNSSLHLNEIEQSSDEE